MITAEQPNSFLRDKSYVATALTHFFNDLLVNGRATLVALLAVSLSLSNAQVGLYLVLFYIGGAVAQPFFGILIDRQGARRFVVGGVALIISMYFVAAVSSDWIALLAVTLAGVGSGAFHPAGALIVSQASVTQRTQATAIFFGAGQIGLFVGPLLAGVFIDGFGRIGFILLPILALIALAASYAWVRDTKPTAQSDSSPKVELPPIDWKAIHMPTVTALIILMIVLNTIGFAIINLVPKLLAEQAYSATYMGAAAGLVMLGSAIGGVVGGRIADTVSGRMAIIVSLAGAILPLYLYVEASDVWRLLLITLAGFFAGMPHSVLIIAMQKLLPNREAMASGLTLGIMFFGGSLGALAIGAVADQIGLVTALQWMAAVPFVTLAVLPLMRESTPT